METPHKNIKKHANLDVLDAWDLFALYFTDRKTVRLQAEVKFST